MGPIIIQILFFITFLVDKSCESNLKPARNLSGSKNAISY